MKLTKRETTMLTVLAILAVAALVFTLVLQPLQSGLNRKKALRDELELQQVQMQALLESSGMEDTYAEQKQKAAENYDSFYAVLNSYTIDNILSVLMDEHGISVLSMDITPYEQTVWESTQNRSAQTNANQPIQNDEDAAKAQPENILLKSTVRLEAGGSYEDIMRFLNAMNDKSFCLRVRDMNVQFATDRNLLQYETSFSCNIDIYGIEVTGTTTADLA